MSEGDRIEAHAASAGDLGLEVPEGFLERVSVTTWRGTLVRRAAWAESYRIELVIAFRPPPQSRSLDREQVLEALGRGEEVDLGCGLKMCPDEESFRRAMARGEVIELGTVRPLPWLRLTEGWSALLRASVWRMDQPDLRWVWQAGRISLTGLEQESATAKAVRRALPGLTLLRRVVRKGGAPRQTEKRSRRAARIRQRLAAGDDVYGAGLEEGVERATAYRDLRDFPKSQ